MQWVHIRKRAVEKMAVVKQSIQTAECKVVPGTVIHHQLSGSEADFLNRDLTSQFSATATRRTLVCKERQRFLCNRSHGQKREADFPPSLSVTVNEE